MSAFRASPLGITIVAVVLLVLLALTATSTSLQSTSAYTSKVISYAKLKPGSESSTKATTSSLANRITNRTLGFQQVLAVGLPERSDKRDALALSSSLTGGGFKIDWISGVRGESIPDKAVPFGTDRKKLWENNLGSWRGHMNAVRSIVENNIASALIMEDDMDWDIRLKTQLEQFAAGAQHIQKTSFNSTPSVPSLHDSPYGSNWDLLWLGHCGEAFPEALEEYPPPKDGPEKYIIHPDPTLPPTKHVKGQQDYFENPNTRWVHVSGGPVCTFAYALSYTGAQKVLYDLSVDHLLGPFDNALANLCRYGNGLWGIPAGKGGLNVRCISVTPPLFFHHKSKGYVGGDSDIQKVGGQELKDQEIREKGFTENIDMSARNNVQRLLVGLDPIRQFEEDDEKP